jgi:hypothetical protein
METCIVVGRIISDSNKNNIFFFFYQISFFIRLGTFSYENLSIPQKIASQILYVSTGFNHTLIINRNFIFYFQFSIFYFIFIYFFKINSNSLLLGLILMR